MFEESKGNYDTFVNKVHCDQDNEDDLRTNIVTSPSFNNTHDDRRRKFDTNESGKKFGTLKDEGNENIEQVASQIKRKEAFIWAFGKNGDGELGVGT